MKWLFQEQGMLQDRKVILQLIETSGIGGAETVLLELCRRLDCDRFVPLAVLLREGWLSEQLRAAGVEVLMIENRNSYDLDCLRQIINIIRERKVDIIHSHEFMMNVYGAAAALLTGRKNIMTIHGKNYYSDNLRRRLAYRLASRISSRVVAVSHDLRHFLTDTIGMRNDKVTVIHNGVDIDRFRDNPGADIDPAAPDLNGATVVGTIGNPYPVKGHLYLLQAAAIVLQQFPQTLFAIAGKNTPYMSDLLQEASRLGIENNICFLGFQENIPALLRMFDIFVLSSLQETFSLATVEAMAAGKPVVVTRCGGPEEIVTDGFTGLLVPVKDPEALAEQILKLLQDKATAQRLAEAGQQHVAAQFSLQAMVSSYESLY